MFATDGSPPYSRSHGERRNVLSNAPFFHGDQGASRDTAFKDPLNSETNMRRKKSVFTLDTLCHHESNTTSSTCSSSSTSSSNSASLEDEFTASSVHNTSSNPLNFVFDVMRSLLHQPSLNDSWSEDAEEDRSFDLTNSRIRRVMEPHLRSCRILRDRSRRQQNSEIAVSDSIAGSMNVPYTILRKECPFLFDEHSYPLHTVLAKALSVDSLSNLHVHHPNPDSSPLELLREASHRKAFHSLYDTFVTSFCIPLLHSMAITKGVLHQSTNDRICYRYQAFPHINIALPGQQVYDVPVCDSSLGFSIGCLTFHIPLTSMTNGLYVESHPGKEDWHPLRNKSIGLGHIFDGSRCLYFDLPNKNPASTRVSIMFRIIIYRESSDTSASTDLCPTTLLSDVYSEREDFYEEAYIDLRSAAAVVKKHGTRSLPPSPHLGYP